MFPIRPGFFYVIFAYSLKCVFKPASPLSQSELRSKQHFSSHIIQCVISFFNPPVLFCQFYNKIKLLTPGIVFTIINRLTRKYFNESVDCIELLALNIFFWENIMGADILRWTFKDRQLTWQQTAWNSFDILRRTAPFYLLVLACDTNPSLRRHYTFQKFEVLLYLVRS